MKYISVDALKREINNSGVFANSPVGSNIHNSSDIMETLIKNIPSVEVPIASPGESIGGIYGRGNGRWSLVEAVVDKIVRTRVGTRYYTRGDKFRSLITSDVDSTTMIMEETDGIILVNEVFVLTEKNRDKAERWVAWANANPGKVRSVWDDVIE